jgi:hypothetical protein
VLDQARAYAAASPSDIRRAVSRVWIYLLVTDPFA